MHLKKIIILLLCSSLLLVVNFASYILFPCSPSLSLFRFWRLISGRRWNYFKQKPLTNCSCCFVFFFKEKNWIQPYSHFYMQPRVDELSQTWRLSIVVRDNQYSFFFSECCQVVSDSNSPVRISRLFFYPSWKSYQKKLLGQIDDICFHQYLYELCHRRFFAE